MKEFMPGKEKAKAIKHESDGLFLWGPIALTLLLTATVTLVGLEHPYIAAFLLPFRPLLALVALGGLLLDFWQKGLRFLAVLPGSILLASVILSSTISP